MELSKKNIDNKDSNLNTKEDLSKIFYKRLEKYSNDHFYDLSHNTNDKDNIFIKIKEELTRKLQDDIDLQLEKFSSLHHPKFKDKILVPLKDINIDNDFESFKKQLDKIKLDITSNFIQLLEYEKKVDNELINYNNLYQKVDVLKSLEKHILETNKDTFNILIKDIYENILKKDDFQKYLENYLNLFYKHHFYIKNLKEINCFKTISLCSLCFSNPINITLIPCGHTYCEGCIDKFFYLKTNHQNIKCPSCRKNVINKQKIFII